MVSTIWYDLNSDTYHTLQKGTTSSSIRNDTKQKMLVTKVGLNFDWQATRYWYEYCNIEIAPGDKIDLPTILFTVKLEALTGTHLYKAGVIY